MVTTLVLNRSTPVRRWTWHVYLSYLDTCVLTKIYSNQLLSRWFSLRYFCIMLCWNLRILKFLSIRVLILKWFTIISSWLELSSTSYLFKFRIKCFRKRLVSTTLATGICWRVNLTSKYRSLWLSRRVFTRKISLFQVWHRITTSEVCTKQRNWGHRSISCKR